MKATIILLVVLLFFASRANAQWRTINGRVIDDDLEVVSGAKILNSDKLVLGETGIDGRFKIEIPQNTKTIKFSALGYEAATIGLNSCDTVEIVMIPAGTYDFMSARKIDRIRLRMFSKLPTVQSQAYKSGIFAKPTTCYTREFEPLKPRFDEIKKQDIEIKKQVKLNFKRLNVGDTVSIPFWGQNRADGVDKTTLYSYSFSYSGAHYDYVVKGVIIGKNTRKNSYNLICKVTWCGSAKYLAMSNGKPMQIGEVFTYNMKYFKILPE